MNTVLRNSNRPEYGAVTVPPPIPDKEYDHVLEILAPLEIGDYVERDCQVDQLIGTPPILHKLEHTLVNLDELDYLTKRLDGFDCCELEQYQVLAYARSVSNVQDMIDLTFNSQHVTVINDFSALDSAGKQHYLTAHGGSAKIEEYERVDGRQVSLDLLCDQDEKITPLWSPL